jgi:hypothetical protein
MDNREAKASGWHALRDSEGRGYVNCLLALPAAAGWHALRDSEGRGSSPGRAVLNIRGGPIVVSLALTSNIAGC